MNDADPARRGPEDLGDDELGRLIGEGLRRHTGALVDEHRLLAAATRGAARTRRRRALAVRVAAALVVVLPAGAAAVRMTRQEPATTVSTASQREQADGPSSPEDARAASTAGAGERRSDDGAKDGPASLLSSAAPSVPPLTAGSAASSSADPGSPGESGEPERFAAGTLPVPDGVMLTAADLRDGQAGAAVDRVSDTANRSAAPVPDAGATCGSRLSGAVSAGSRQIVFARRGGGAVLWQVSHTVRVLGDFGAAEYLRAMGGLGCLTPVTVPGAGSALAGQFRDSAGRRHWFGVVREDGTVAEIQVTGSGTDAPSPAEAERLLTVAASRLPVSVRAGTAGAGTAGAGTAGAGTAGADPS